MISEARRKAEMGRRRTEKEGELELAILFLGDELAHPPCSDLEQRRSEAE